MTILDIYCYNEDGTVAWEQHDIPNVFHYDGQNFLLSLAFNTASSITQPANYYLGLDNRASLLPADTLASLSGEPTQNGYSRQPVSSLNGFTVATGPTTNYLATSQVVTFSAMGSGWGPVTNLFLTNVANGTSGYLLASSALQQSRNPTAGQTVTARIAVGLTNC